jgi:hypothetical protein
MQQNAQNTNPVAQKAKADLAKSDQGFQQKQQLQADKIKGGIARDAIKTSLDMGLERELRGADERATDPLIDTGEAGGTFGE